jgi:hypothetical protein
MHSFRMSRRSGERRGDKTRDREDHRSLSERERRSRQNGSVREHDDLLQLSRQERETTLLAGVTSMAGNASNRAETLAKAGFRLSRSGRLRVFYSSQRIVSAASRSPEGR